ncbi:uncharacterized protein BDV17DRAFT_207168 [Aspergillus undulatus]|uniref:uncharacterized protein n=1 Tax=Aspergillus undulatus TaxID=1810928 RepID=UPI003CCCF6E9
MEHQIQEMENKFELLVPYQNPFYPTPKPWTAVDRWMNSISLFYLTDSFTPEHYRALERIS